MASDKKTMQFLVEEYAQSGGSWPLEASAFAEWAVRTGRWQPTAEDAMTLCRGQFSRAMRESYFTDRQGRRIRQKHAVRSKQGGKQYVFWDDIQTAPRAHMERAFQQRRDQIVGDCRQLKNDVDSYNDAHLDASPIQLVLNFNVDMEELEIVQRSNSKTMTKKPRWHRTPLALVAERD